MEHDPFYLLVSSLETYPLPLNERVGRAEARVHERLTRMQTGKNYSKVRDYDDQNVCFQ